MSLIRKHGAVLQAWACLALVSSTPPLPVRVVLQMSTEVAKSFTSKDLAETFPRRLASLEHLRQEVSQPEDISELSADAADAAAAAAAEKAISRAAIR